MGGRVKSWVWLGVEERPPIKMDFDGSRHRREVRLSDNGDGAQYNASRGTVEMWKPHQGTPRGGGTHQDPRKGVCLPRGRCVTAICVNETYISVR